MLEDLLFSLECVSPYFLLILAGYLVRRTGLVSEAFLKSANHFTFVVALPVNLFLNTSAIQWASEFQPGFMLFLLLSTLLSFCIIWPITELFYRRKRELIGTLVQGSFRGNYVLLGIPIVNAVMGNDPVALAQATLASAVLIPLYNLLSVIVLLLRGKGNGAPNARSLAVSVIQNPLIIGTLAGVAFSLIATPFRGLAMPRPLTDSWSAVRTALGYISGAAIPLGLLSVGGIFNWEDATARLGPSLYAVVFKNFAMAAVMLPIAYLLGFRSTELVIVLIAFAAPVAVSSYAMAAQMGGDAPLAANILILSTLLSAFGMAGGIYLIRSLGWI